MTARILVVDDIEANVRLLEAKLRAEYYEVITAHDGPTALALAAAESPDIVLLDVMMPGMDGFEVCLRLKNDPETRHIPVVLVTALDGRVDRLTGLEAGADDFLTKPVDDLMLFARVRSLTRLKLVVDELREREKTGRAAGAIDGAGLRLATGGARVLIVDDNPRQAQRVFDELAREHRPVIETEPERALLTARGSADLVILSAVTRTFDGLRLAAQLRSDAETRHLPVLCVVEADERPRVVKALEIGVSDVLSRPVDPQELAARVKTQLRRKRYTDVLRDTLDRSLEAAVTDPLTGLHNRRYMNARLKALTDRAELGGGPLSLLLLDIDHFKRVNDGYGHPVGDEVIREFAIRMVSNVRAVDIPCRLGGEEFVVVMPDTRAEDACRIAERIRLAAAGAPYRVANGSELLTVTVSAGVADWRAGDTGEDLLRRADAALYEAKGGGRNRVVAAAA